MQNENSWVSGGSMDNVSGFINPSHIEIKSNTNKVQEIEADINIHPMSPFFASGALDSETDSDRSYQPSEIDGSDQSDEEEQSILSSVSS
jgi:hypothetical protein